LRAGTVEVCNFRLAVNSGFGEKKATSFLRCVAFGKNATNIALHFRKGSRIIIEGRIEQSSYTAKDGSKKETIQIVVDGWHFVESKAQTESVHEDEPF
jgi:single-strand DNA-binding protein